MSEELLYAADEMFKAADALLKSNTTSEELKRARDLRVAINLYAQERAK